MASTTVSSIQPNLRFGTSFLDSSKYRDRAVNGETLMDKRTGEVVFKRKEDTECFRRRIEADTIKYAATILMMYLTLCLMGGIIISCLENLPMLTCLFETASAIGTVGLTLGITSQLGMISRIILIILMFLGRVGCLTLVFAAFSGTQRNISRYPKEKITVG